MLVSCKPDNWEANRPHAGLRKGLSGPDLWAAMFSWPSIQPIWGQQDPVLTYLIGHNRTGWAGVGVHCTVVLSSPGAAPKHLPRIQGSSAMVATPKDNSEAGALLPNCHHTCAVPREVSTPQGSHCLRLEQPGSSPLGLCWPPVHSLLTVITHWRTVTLSNLVAHWLGQSGTSKNQVWEVIISLLVHQHSGSELMAQCLVLSPTGKPCIFLTGS